MQRSYGFSGVPSTHRDGTAQTARREPLRILSRWLVGSVILHFLGAVVRLLLAWLSSRVLWHQVWPVLVSIVRFNRKAMYCILEMVRIPEHVSCRVVFRVFRVFHVFQMASLFLQRVRGKVWHLAFDKGSTTTVGSSEIERGRSQRGEGIENIPKVLRRRDRLRLGS